MARIAHIVSTYPPYQGGMGNVAASLHEGLLARGHASEVFTPGYDTSATSSESIHRLKPLLKFGNAAWLPSLGAQLKDFDVVHLHYPFFGGAESVAWAMRKRRAGQRFVVTYHMDTIGSGVKSVVFSAYKSLIMPAVLRSADLITVSSLDYARNSALASFISRLRIEELTFGVDARFAPIKRSGLNVEGKLNLLFVGALDRAHYFKGLNQLLMAVALAKQDGVPVVLTVIGDGDTRKSYKATAHELGLASHVHFMGKASQVDLIAAYQQADMTVLPSIDRSEAFGLVLIESLACGTPVMASDLPGVRTVFENNVSGFTVQVGNVQSLTETIQRVWADRAKLDAMRVAATLRAEKLYRWPGIIQKLEALYNL